MMTFDGVRDVEDGSVQLEAVELPALRVHQVGLPRELVCEVRGHDASRLVGVCGGPDDAERIGVKK
jgi:hypothetical protein